MHVMIATDGSLDAEAVVSVVGPLVSGGGQLTVFTAVEVPRGFLSDIRASIDQDTSQLRDVMVEYGGDKSDPAGLFVREFDQLTGAIHVSPTRVLVTGDEGLVLRRRR